MVGEANTKIICQICKVKPADWDHMSARVGEPIFYCDDCVPRGCSCNSELKDGIDYNSREADNPENWVERLDDKGRKLPCCEYDGMSEEEHRWCIEYYTTHANSTVIIR